MTLGHKPGSSWRVPSAASFQQKPTAGALGEGDTYLKASLGRINLSLFLFFEATGGTQPPVCPAFAPTFRSAQTHLPAEPGC